MNLSLSSSHPILLPTGRVGEEAEPLCPLLTPHILLVFMLLVCLFFLLVQGSVKIHVQIRRHSGHRLDRFGLHNPLLITLIAAAGSHIPGCHTGKVSLCVFFFNTDLGLVKSRKARI